MIKSILNSGLWHLKKSVCNARPFQPFPSVGYEQIRTTFVVKRKYPPELSKYGGKFRRLRGKFHIYDLIENTSTRKQPSIKLILIDDVEGVGSKGEIVEARPEIAHTQLLPGNQAVYASPENLAILEEEMGKGEIIQHKQSSHWAPKTAQYLSTFLLSVTMNMEEQWTLEPWHVRVSFRKSAIFVPEHAITMPIHPIMGPDMNIEGKEFIIQIKINNLEKAYVRSRIHHWSTILDNRLPAMPDHWRLPAEPLFPEEADILSKLPKPPSFVNVAAKAL